MKIYLIGMPGSGKSTIGVQLAEALNTAFVDLDKEIESEENSSVAEIFKRHGEDYFRLKEAEKLRQFAGSDKSFVLATGGGAPCFYNGIETINKSGVSVFLNVEIKELVRRLARKKDRPLLQNDDLESKLTQIRETRLSTYSLAAITVNDPTPAKVLDAIRRNIQR